MLQQAVKRQEHPFVNLTLRQRGTDHRARRRKPVELQPVIKEMCGPRGGNLGRKRTKLVVHPRTPLH